MKTILVDTLQVLFSLRRVFSLLFMLELTQALSQLGVFNAQLGIFFNELLKLFFERISFCQSDHQVLGQIVKSVKQFFFIDVIETPLGYK